MARAISHLPCKYCGEMFRHVIKHNTWNAEQAESYVEWTQWNLFVCPDCLTEVRKKEEFEMRRYVHSLYTLTFGPMPPLGEAAFLGRDRFLLEVYRATNAERQSKYADCTEADIDMMWLTAQCLVEIIDFDEPWEKYWYSTSPAKFASRLVARYVIEYVDWFRRNYPELAPAVENQVGNKYRNERARRKALDALGPRPEPPRFVQGHVWNSKVYGRAGAFAVFLDGVRIAISADEALQIKKWKENLSTWKAKKAELESKVKYF